MKFVKKLRDGEYTIENNQACFSFIFTVFRLFIAGLSVKSEKNNLHATEYPFFNCPSTEISNEIRKFLSSSP